MSNHPLMQKHSGPLHVIIHTLEEETESFDLNYKNSTLFEYVGGACACIFRNLTTKLVVRMKPEDWEIQRFSAEEGILEVRQIGGEPLRIKDDDPERLALLF